MEYIRNEVISCLSQFSDDRLIEELALLIEKEGDRACQVILHVLTHLDMEPEEAGDNWQKIVEHRRTLNERLGRNIDLRTAICDYFCTVHQTLKNPKIVEILVFERALKTCRYDPLTGLFNRLAFEEEVVREISRARRYDIDLSLLFFDLDNFKKVNDTYGHLAGDLVLKNVANAILDGKRAEDIAVRYGGEEMVLLLPKTEKYNALLVAERIREEIEALEIDYEGAKVPITISGGLASFPIDAANAYHLVQRADEALYRAKGEGKNRVVLYTTNKRRYRRLEVNVPLKLRIIGTGEIPVVDIQSKDFSLNGILFEYHLPIELSTKIQLMVTINADADPVQIIGTVVRVEAYAPDKFDIGVSISFQEMAFSNKEKLSGWYDSLKEVQETD